MSAHALGSIGLLPLPPGMSPTPQPQPPQPQPQPQQTSNSKVSVIPVEGWGDAAGSTPQVFTTHTLPEVTPKVVPVVTAAPERVLNFEIHPNGNGMQIVHESSVPQPVAVEKLPDQVIDLPGGWVKRIVHRASGATQGRFDVYLTAPGARKRLRSTRELVNYLVKTHTVIDPNEVNFDKSKNQSLEWTF